MSSLTEQMVEVIYNNKDNDQRNFLINKFLQGIMYQLLRSSSVCFSIDANKIEEFKSVNMGIDIDTVKDRVYIYSTDSINNHVISDGEVNLDILFSDNPGQYPIYNGWIDASKFKPKERLPLFVSDGIYPVIGYYAKPPNYNEHGFFARFSLEGNEILIPLKNVTHWMPLPVCPKDERMEPKCVHEDKIHRSEPPYMQFNSSKRKKKKKRR